jgi:dolichol-phosphate mannosyltransferase
MDLSVVIPAKDEAANVAPLVAELRAALDGLLDYEILYVDDGSEDGTAAEVARLQASVPHLRLLRLVPSCGQSAAVRSGVRAARAAWITTLDGDGQNDPADIPKLWRIGLTAPEAPSLLIAGYRESRQDRWTKRFASQIANRVRRRMLGDGTPDTGCGLKLFPRSLFLDLPYFDHMHRFLPALVLREGGIVRSIRVNHRARRGGVSKYGIFDRLGVGVVDLFGVIWLKRRAARPHLLDEVLPDPKTASTSASISVVR